MKGNLMVPSSNPGQASVGWMSLKSAVQQDVKVLIIHGPMDGWMRRFYVQVIAQGSAVRTGF